MRDRKLKQFYTSPNYPSSTTRIINWLDLKSTYKLFDIKTKKKFKAEDNIFD